MWRMLGMRRRLRMRGTLGLRQTLGMRTTAAACEGHGAGCARREKAHRRLVHRRLLICAAAMLGAALAAPASASAAIANVLGGHTISGAPIPCVAQSDGVRVCHGSDNGVSGPDLRLKSFDGVPLEVYVILPPAPSSGADGPYPTIVQSHGWGSSAGGPNNGEFYGPTADQWARQGYAVLQLTARGFGDSCGKVAQRSELPAYYAAVCANGYIRLDDERYEARDVQYALGLLVDEGIVAPGHIGVTGESYGGGVSLELATLRNRVINADGSLSPWTSPNGTPLSITAAAPVIPWSDLVYALVPNGHTLDYQITSPTADLSPFGVPKDSYVSGLFALGEATGYYVTPGVNPQADLTTWFASVQQGDPPTAEDSYILDQIARYHSPYYLLDGAYGAARQEPPPLLIANGFTDDLFPVDEALRYYNLAHALYPSDPISLFDWDGGHARGQNKPADNALLAGRIQAFFNYYLRGSGRRPATGFTALTETCPKTAPSGGPFQSPTWAGLHPGEVIYNGGSAQTVTSTGADPSASRVFDPIAGGGACATATAGSQGPGVAVYRLPTVSGPGYTLLGSPTVIADLTATGAYPQIDAWLLDVDPSTGTETLVARGLYRLNPSSPNGFQVFQLHPGAWHFAAGHVPELELLGQDAPYARPNNEPFSVTISSLQLRLPVHERPGTVPGVVAPLSALAPACSNLPHSRLDKPATHAYPRLLVASGTAGERPCSGGTAAQRERQRVAHVYVMIYRRLADGRCRFLQRDGRLTAPRSCAEPVEYLAHGTTRWSLHLVIRIPPGTYYVRSDAVDGYGRHQPRTAASVKRVTVAAASARRPVPHFTG